VPGLLFSGSAHAALINWGNVQNISGPGSTTVSTATTEGGGGSGATITDGTNDVNEQGTQVLGINYSGPPGQSYPYTATIDGQTFYSFRDYPAPSGGTPYPVTYSVTGLNDAYNQYTPGAAGQSYGYYNSAYGPNPDYTLANASFDDNSLTASITLGNLILGDQYLVQFWVSDPRNPQTQDRVETLTSSTGGDTNSPTLDYEGSDSTDGQWVTGTFVADATMTETLDLSASNSNQTLYPGDGSPQVNLLQLRDITPVPEPASFALVGLGALALRRRRA
jgi:MYXO-CTERM domain-containing protein